MAKSLHELNLEQRKIDAALSKKLSNTPLGALPADIRRIVAKRLQKPARGPLAKKAD